MGREARAARHRALGDEHRLAIMDALVLSDHTSGELASLAGLPTNLLAFHLDVLEEVGLVTRHRSQGDGRRRYVTLGPDAGEVMASLGPVVAAGGRAAIGAERVLFVCTHNSARSQLAAAMWTARTGRASWSAGAHPAEAVHPRAVDLAGAHGLDLADARPAGYQAVEVEPDLVVSVCDRAREGQPPFAAPLLHWSIPEPVEPADFPVTWNALDRRIDRLARAAAA